jgi:hypothetical protein
MDNFQKISHCIKIPSSRLTLNGTHQLLIYADDANLLAEHINTITKKKTNALLHASKKVGLDVNRKLITR